MMKSNLKIFKNGQEIPLPKGSNRFIDVSTKQIAQAGEYMLCLDGSVEPLSSDEMRKLEVTLSCSSFNIPPISGIWSNDILTIYSPELESEPGPALTLQWEPVPGSVIAYAADGTELARPEGRTVYVQGAAYFTYRPIFVILVTAAPRSGKEGKASRGWSISGIEYGAGVAIDPIPDLPEQLVVATGGTVTDYTDESGAKWREHDFTGADIFSVSAPGAVEFAILGGGGGGGSLGGGGGAGSIRLSRTYIDIGDCVIEVGSGGARGYNGYGNNRNGSAGSKTSIKMSTQTGVQLFEEAIGGGGGHGGTSTWNSQRNGGSGGGSRVDGVTAPAGVAYGPNGHNGGSSPDVSDASGGGGGGAGGPGGISSSGGFAGPGIYKSDIFPGSSDLLMLAVGGPGGRSAGMNGSPGGAQSSGEDGPENTGSGGAGNNSIRSQGKSDPGSHGGSGRVIIRYRIA
jgi:hypothetical protein